MHHNMMQVEDFGFEMEINHYADLTPAEFKAKLGYKSMVHADSKEYASINSGFVAP
jgi:hypothetical protein